MTEARKPGEAGPPLRSVSSVSSAFSVARLFKITVSVLLLAFVFRSAGSQQLVDLIASLELARLLLPLLIFLAAQAVYAMALNRLIASMGHPAPYGPILANHYKGLFWASFLPSTMGGDVYRVVDLGTIIGSRTAAFAAIVAQRTIAMALALLTAAIALPILTDYRPALLGLGSSPALSNALLALAVVLLVAAGGAVLLMVYRGRLGARLQTILRNLLRAFSGLLELRGLVTVTLLLLVSQGIVILGVGLLSSALGIEVSWWHYTYVVPLMLIATAVPISINGIGIREGAFVVLLGLQSVPAAQAAALGMLLTILGFVYTIIGAGLFALARERLA